MKRNTWQMKIFNKRGLEWIGALNKKRNGTISSDNEGS